MEKKTKLNELKTKLLIHEYTELMQLAESCTSRKQAIKLINKATTLLQEINYGKRKATV